MFLNVCLFLAISSPRAPFRIHLYALSVHFSETLRCSTLVSDSSSLRLRSLPCLLAREKFSSNTKTPSDRWRFNEQHCGYNICGEKGEMLTSKTRPQGQFLSAFGCLAAVRATSTLKLNDYPSHKSKPEEYVSFFWCKHPKLLESFFCWWPYLNWSNVHPLLINQVDVWNVSRS